MEPAVFRPPLRPLGAPMLLGALAGAALCAAFDVPPLLGALFGAVAAAIVLAAQQVRGLRVVADERGVAVIGAPPARPGPPQRAGGAAVAAAWSELRLGFGIAQRADGRLQRYAIVADPLGRSFAFTEGLGRVAAGAVRGADGREVPVVDLRDAPLLLAIAVQRVPAWNVLPESLQAAPGVSGAEPLTSMAAQPAAARVSERSAEGAAAGTRGPRDSRVG